MGTPIASRLFAGGINRVFREPAYADAPRRFFKGRHLIASVAPDASLTRV